MSTSLSPEQKAAVATWIAAGDNLSVVQKKLRDQFNLALTYMDVRFLVDDLELTLKDPAPKADAADVGKAPPASKPAAQPSAGGGAAPAKKGFIEKAKEKLGLGGGAGAADEAAGADEFADEDVDGLPPEDEALPPGASAVVVDVDAVTLLPGAIASGTVRFSDGVTGKWMVDQYGRPGFTEISQPGYRPTKEDAQAFMQELDEALRKKGF